RISLEVSMPKPSNSSRCVGGRQSTSGVSEVMKRCLRSCSTHQWRSREPRSERVDHVEHDAHRQLVPQLRPLLKRDGCECPRTLDLAVGGSEAEMVLSEVRGDELAREFSPVEENGQPLGKQDPLPLLRCPCHL